MPARGDDDRGSPEPGILLRIALEKGWLRPDQIQELIHEARQGLDTSATVGGARAPEARTTRTSIPEDTDFGKYLLIDQIGSGGFGDVYRAFEKDLGRYVALKVLLSENPDDGQRFLREARTAANLTHPNIVPIHEVAEHGGMPYIAMKFIEGQTLKLLRLDPTRAAKIAATVADVVQHAHESGIIHRDLKPENLMLDMEGRVWVMDFGLARPVATGSTVTVSGIVIGTPAYMSPEQSRGDRCDARSDVYSLGATLYEMLTGRLPFQATSPIRLLQQVQEIDPVPPRSIHPEIPVDLQTIVLKAMEKKPALRYQTAKEFGDDLRRHLEGEPILAKPPGIGRKIRRSFRRRRTLWVASLLMVAVAVALGGTMVGRSWIRAAELDRLTTDAHRCMKEKDWSGAAALFSEASKIAPDDPALRTMIRAAGEMDRARRALSAREMALQTIRDTRIPELEDHAPPSEKEVRWRAEDTVRRAEAEARSRGQEAEQAALAALAFDPDLHDAKALLAELYLERHEQAWGAKDRLRAERLAGLVLKYGGEEYRERIERPATMDLTTEPADSTAFLFRYEERQRRLIPLPCNELGVSRDVEIPDAEPVEWTAHEEAKLRVRRETVYPLYCGDYNRVTFPLRLRSGSYLVLFRRDGYAETRYPVLLERGARVAATVRMLRPEDIPEGFLYIPAGDFIAGGDPEAQEAIDVWSARRTSSTEGFFISRFSVTSSEYLKFLNDRSHHSLSEASRYQPRASSDRRPYWGRRGDLFVNRWNEDEPIVGLAWYAADAYARWYAETHGRGKWAFRLPTVPEWERAARGADGRFHPWGDHFDPAFCAMRSSRSAGIRSRSSILERFGLFPADESPFGVRDMAGVARNWTATAVPGTSTRVIKGGSWQATAIWSRAVSYSMIAPIHFDESQGIRLVADLRE